MTAASIYTPGRYARRMRYPGENSAAPHAGPGGRPVRAATPPEQRTAAGGVSPGRKSPGGDPSLFAPGYSGGSRGPRPCPAGRRRAVRNGCRRGGQRLIRGFAPPPGSPAAAVPARAVLGLEPHLRRGRQRVRRPGERRLAGRREPEATPGLPAGPRGRGGLRRHGVCRHRVRRRPGLRRPRVSRRRTRRAGRPGRNGAVPRARVPPWVFRSRVLALAVSDPAADVTSTQSWSAVDNAAASRWSDLTPADDQWSRPEVRQGAGSGFAAPPGATVPPGATPPAGLAQAPPGGRDDRSQAGGPPDRSTGPLPDLGLGATDAATRVATGAPNQRVTTGPSQRADGGVGSQRRRRGRASPGRPGPRPTRGRSKPGGRGRPAPSCSSAGLALIVVIGATYFWFARGGKHQTAATGATNAKARPSPTDPSPTRRSARGATSPPVRWTRCR